MLAMAGSTFADDTFSVDAVTLPATSEADVVVRYNLDAESYCSGYQFWLQLPEELEFVTYTSSGQTLVSYTAGDCYADAQAVTANVDEGYLKVACNTNGSVPLTKQSGILVTFKVKVKQGATVTVGGQPLTGNLIKGKISNPNGLVHDVANSEFSITITDRVVLDETSTMAPSAATGVNVQVKRTIKAGEWNTICLPFSMTEEQILDAFGEGVEVVYFDSFTIEGTATNVTSITINFEEIALEDGMEANYPYLIKIAGNTNITEFLVDDVDVNPDEVLVTYTKGSGSKKLQGDFIGTYMAETEIPANGLFLSGNKFYYSVGLTKMKAFRCYLMLNRVLANTGANAPIFINIGGETTKVEGLTIDPMDDNYYTLDGRLVKTPGKGVYIKNGKKVIVK